MPRPPSAYDLHQRDYWLRHDAHRFIRHDFKRFLKPGTDPADVYPALARAHAEPYIRDTFGVEVVIRPDPGSARGWRVHTAYPVR
jgi:hypothetical protein